MGKDQLANQAGTKQSSEKPKFRRMVELAALNLSAEKGDLRHAWGVKATPTCSPNPALRMEPKVLRSAILRECQEAP